jgi:hypothetical protein
VVWRLGIPAVLMIAFALVGLTTRVERGVAVSVPADVVAAVVAAAETPRSPVSPAPAPAVVAEAADAGEEPVSSSREPDDDERPPTLRLPEELGPEAPDVIVALALPPTDVEMAVYAVDTSAPDSLTEIAQAPVALAPASGDDVQGPEPGARYWFGPDGLERIEVVGEVRR